MDKKLKYEVVDSETVDSLVETVQQRIADGWQPLGGPFFLNGSFYQAIVLPDDSGSRIEQISYRSRPRQSEIELIEELTEDDEPIALWDGGLENGRGGSVGG
jgi:hypothetical protein